MLGREDNKEQNRLLLQTLRQCLEIAVGRQRLKQSETQSQDCETVDVAAVVVPKDLSQRRSSTCRHS